MSIEKLYNINAHTGLGHTVMIHHHMIKILNLGEKISITTSTSRNNSYEQNMYPTETIIYDDDKQLTKSQIILFDKIMELVSSVQIFNNYSSDSNIKVAITEVIKCLKDSNVLPYTKEEEFFKLQLEYEQKLNTKMIEIEELNESYTLIINSLKFDHEKKIDKEKLKYEQNEIRLMELNSIQSKKIEELEHNIENLKDEIFDSSILFEEMSEKYKKSNKKLLDKIDRINNNIVEKTLQNDKLQLQLQDITDLYNVLIKKINKDCN
jgi:hypothetical protein